MVSKHYHKSRYKREKTIKRYVHGDGEAIKEFVIDNHHKDGKEIHTITNTGIIIISNYATKKIVTKLIARPRQIERYYESEGLEAPKWLLQLAQWHTDLHYNK